MVGSEGTLGFIVDAKISLVPLPAQKARADDRVRSPARCARRDAADPEARTVGRRGDGRLHPVARARAIRARCAAARDDQRRRLGAAVRGVLRRLARRADGADGGGRARSRSARGRAAMRAGARSAGAAGDLELPRSGARPVDGDEDATARRSRSSKTPRSRRRSCATTSSASSASCSGTTPPPASTRTRRSAACTCGRWSTSRPPTASRSSRRSPTRSPISCSSSAARCPASTATAWCAARSTRRCSARSSTRRSAQVKQTFDPQRPLQSRPHRRHAADHVAPALRRRLRDAVAGDVLRLLRSRRLRPRGRDVQRRRAVPQEARRHDVPVVHGDARRSALDARAGQHAAAGDDRTAWRREALGRRACTRCSICASSAAPARANARSASTWRDSRASSSPATGIATACRWPRRRSAARRPPRHGAAASRRSRTRSPTARIARWVAEKTHRHRSPAIAAAMDAADAAQADSGIRDQGSGIRGIGALLFADTFTESRRSGDRPGRDRRAECGRHRHTRRAERVLRPAADFAGPPVGRAPAGRGQRPRALRRRAIAATRSCSWSRAACRRCARMRRICCAASCSGAPAWSRSSAVLFEEFLEARVRATAAPRCR